MQIRGYFNKEGHLHNDVNIFHKAQISSGPRALTEVNLAMAAALDSLTVTLLIV